eukprot:6808251-Prymnesium_polylepis.3
MCRWARRLGRSRVKPAPPELHVRAAHRARRAFLQTSLPPTASYGAGQAVRRVSGGSGCASLARRDGCAPHPRGDHSARCERERPLRRPNPGRGHAALPRLRPLSFAAPPPAGLAALQAPGGAVASAVSSAVRGWCLYATEWQHLRSPAVLIHLRPTAPVAVTAGTAGTAGAWALNRGDDPRGQAYPLAAALELRRGRAYFTNVTNNASGWVAAGPAAAFRRGGTAAPDGIATTLASWEERRLGLGR